MILSGVPKVFYMFSGNSNTLFEGFGELVKDLSKGPKESF